MSQAVKRRWGEVWYGVETQRRGRWSMVGPYAAGRVDGLGRENDT
jgi:hypothetical protein